VDWVILLGVRESITVGTVIVSGVKYLAIDVPSVFTLSAVAKISPLLFIAITPIVYLLFAIIFVIVIDEPICVIVGYGAVKLLVSAVANVVPVSTL
jgi:hypothetical protein